MSLIIRRRSKVPSLGYCGTLQKNGLVDDWEAQDAQAVWSAIAHGQLGCLGLDCATSSSTRTQRAFKRDQQSRHWRLRRLGKSADRHSAPAHANPARPAAWLRWPIGR